MALNNFIVRINFISLREKHDYEGYVDYQIINGKLSCQKWFVSNSTNEKMIGKYYNSISKLTYEYKDSTITGALGLPNKSAVIINKKIDNVNFEYFYQSLPSWDKGESINKVCVMDRISENLSSCKMNYSEFEIISLEKALVIFPNLKKSLECLN